MKVKILFLFLTLFIIFIVWKSNFLTVEKIKVTNLAECVNLDDLNSEINSLDKSWVLIDPNKIKIKLVTKFSCIKDVNVLYEFPKTVNIIVYGRKFLAKVYFSNFSLIQPDLESTASSETALIDWNFPSESSEDALIIDETGYIFTKVKSNYSIPTIFLTDNINIGSQFDKQAFSRIDQIFSKIITFPPIFYQPNFKAKKYGNKLFINSSPKLAFSLEKDVLKQLASLQLILQKDKMDEKVAEFIDLRFDKPVVQYHTNSSK